jgi:hypothetical protein
MWDTRQAARHFPISDNADNGVYVAIVRTPKG